MMNSASSSRSASGVRKSFRACLLVIAIGLVLAFSAPAFAQSIYASLSGTVTDASGAVVVGAKINVVNSATNVGRHLVTNKDGYFSATQLQVGPYNVTVEAKGFEKWQGNGIALQSNDDKALTIPLKVGSENVSVTVSADSDQIDVTDTGAKVNHIDSKDLEKLAMVGRNATEYLKLLPGSSMSSNGGTNRSQSFENIGINASSVAGGVGGLGASNINGQAGLGISINQDGQNVMDPGSIGNATPVNANPDMISELTVLSSNYGADNAKGPVVINALTKSGGSQFHGDIRFAERHKDLNAEDAFSKAEEAGNPTSYTRGELKGGGIYSYPGFNLGGPLFIPGTKYTKEKSKLFFHEGAENYRQLLDGGLTRAFVPTTAELGGDFSGAAGLTAGGQFPYSDYNWLNRLSSTPTASASVISDIGTRGTCLISNTGVLAPGCISPSAQMLMKASLPAPTSATLDSHGFNYAAPVQAHQNSVHNDLKIDLNLTDNTKAYVNWSVCARASPFFSRISAGDVLGSWMRHKHIAQVVAGAGKKRTGWSWSMSRAV